MIQFNLLPDIKLATVKSAKLQRVVTVISSIVAGVCLFIMIVLFAGVRFQKAHINSLTSSIQTSETKLQNTPNLTQILTVQNQLNSLPALYDQRPVASRLSTFISQITPVQATISQLDVDFTKNTISISGSADTLATVDKYVDTMKFSTYKTSSKAVAKDAFSDVLLSSFGYSSESGANYTITANFDPLIFSSTYDISLTVPNLITTRSVTQSKILFQPQTSDATTSKGND